MTVVGGSRAAPATSLRPAWAEIDLAAIRHNARLLADLVAPAELCAVVKAWGYGHGPARVAQAALEGGASWLAVALVEEGRQLRAAGITAPVLVLSEPPAAAMGEVVRFGLTPTIYTDSGLVALTLQVAALQVAARQGAALQGAARQGAVRQGAAARVGAAAPFPVHVKVDTGMHRVGATPSDAVDLARRVACEPALELQGLWTHLAVADEVESPDTARQLATFRATVAQLAGFGIRPRWLHAANSAGALLHPDSRLDLVRCGIALYGLAPAAGLVATGPCQHLQPALSLRAQVSFVKEVAAGERLSYGLHYRAPTRTVVATVPVGYADGVSRRLSSTGGQVLIGGHRRPIAGTVTMDQILIDCGPEADVAPGDVVVLLGCQGGEQITAWEWADRLDTIAYEVVCGVGVRVPRVYRP